jgi:hypothetical protein
LTINSTVTGNNLSNLSYNWYLDNIIQSVTGSSFIFNGSTTASATIKLVVQRAGTSCFAEDSILITPQDCCLPFSIVVDTACMVASVQGASTELFDYVWSTTDLVPIILQTNSQVNTSTLTTFGTLVQGNQVKVKVSKSPTCFEESIVLVNPPLLTTSSNFIGTASSNAAFKTFIVSTIAAKNCAGTSTTPSPTNSTYFINYTNAQLFNSGDNGYVFKNTTPCTNISTLGPLDMVNDVNNWLASLGKSATISWNPGTNTITYTALDPVNEFENLYIGFNRHGSCNATGSTSTGFLNLYLDFPCQCP